MKPVIMSNEEFMDSLIADIRDNWSEEEKREAAASLIHWGNSPVGTSWKQAYKEWQEERARRE